MSNFSIEWVSAFIFALALIHTFSVKVFEGLAHRYPSHSGLFHLLGEVEIVFGFWAVVLIFTMAAIQGSDKALAYAQSRQYTEPLFVFVVMVIAASRPVLEFVMSVVDAAARALPVRTSLARVWIGLCVVPLIGSAITEPAAMTIAALMLAPQIFKPKVPTHQKYFALGVLFVNVSIGGTLTSFAAPPVLMVAPAWGWDSAFMLHTFGWKSAIAVVINATLAVLYLRKSIGANEAEAEAEVDVDVDVDAENNTRVKPIPFLITAVHLLFLAGVVALAHHSVAFIGLFLLFLGFAQAYESHQNPLIIKEALLVGFFLAGLVVLGGMQEWWLQPMVSGMTPQTLFWGTTALTAVTDNAALTYLGSLITDMSDEAKYSLVAGAVSGGGLTVIANAPNPAGVALLRHGFSDASIGAWGLLLGALVPTFIAMLALGVL